MDAAKHSNRILFVDTDTLTTVFYSEFLLKDKIEIANCTKLAEIIHTITEWDLVLFLEPSAAFVQDGARNETIANDRENIVVKLRIY